MKKLLLCSITLAIGVLSAIQPRTCGAQCQAGFTYGIQHDTVVFANTSTNCNPTLYWWDFGDGTYQTDSGNAIHIYAYNGWYDVCLSIYDSANWQNSSSFCDTIEITNGINPSCNAGFTFYPDTSTSGIWFYDQSGNNPVSWFWNFGDSSTSTQQNTFHQYAQTGTYNVCLTIVDAFNDTCTACNTVYNYPCNIQARFAFNNGNDPQIAFTNTSTGGYAPFYYWDFGDGDNSTVVNPTYAYQYNGTYMVCLYAYDSLNWCSASYCDTLTIYKGTIPPCYAGFTFYSDTSTNGIWFYDQSANNPVSWFWNFGDSSTSTQQNTFHQYAQTGTYNVCLTIVDSFHDTCTACNTVYNYPCNMQAGFTFNNANDPQITFTNTSTGGYAPSYYWDFGDGDVSTDVNPTYTYQYNGTYMVCLYAYDSLNWCSASYCDTLTIHNGTIPPCNAGFTFYSDTSTNGIRFYDESANNPVSWLWNFGDGSTSTQQNPFHQYAQTGTYTVCLTIVDAFNDTCTACNTVYNYPCNMQAGFTFNNANDPQIAFTNTSTGGYAPYYYWDFGDGDNSTDLNPTYTYQYNGTYMVCLYTYDSLNWCSASYCDTLTIHNGTIPPCNADFTFYPDTSASGIWFYDQSGSNPVSWFWNFGDSSTSTQQNTFHQYAQTGTYNVCLTIVDSFHDTCTACNTVYNYPCNMQAGFTFNNANDPQITFTNTSTGGYAPSYYWDFGDGDVSTDVNPTYTYQYNGTYMVCLYAYDSLNWCSASYCDTLTIYKGTIPPCNAGFTFYSDTSTNGIWFYDQSGNNPVSWLWNFGDSSTSTQQNPFHQYAQTGTYNVCLTIVDAFNDTCTACNNVAAVSAAGNDACSVNIVLVQDSVNSLLWYVYNYETGTPPFSFLWNFGDGDTSTSPHPSHTYATAGHYAICVTITDSLGCTSSNCDSTYRIAESGLMQYLTVENPVVAGIVKNEFSVNSVFPNPSNNMIEVSLSQFILGELNITDMTGREVYKEKINTNFVTINVSNLLIGCYDLSIMSGTKIIHNKIIIAR